MLCIALILSVLAVATSTSSVNYCGSRVCGNTNTHTFCQFPEGPSPHCVGYIKAHLTMEEKARLMARLNRRRNEAASGRLRGLPSAGNMLKLRWVEELAREAQRWADQCRPSRTPEEHDSCRDLYSIPVGQCVASVVGEAPGLRIESMIDMWYMQSILYKGNVTYYIPPAQNGSFYGDFGQIMWSRTYMVGCARSRFMALWHGRLRSVERLVCNLAPHGPIPARPLWAPAAPASNCPPRAIPDGGFSALCNFHQNVEEMSFIETSMTLEEHILLNTVLDIENNQSLNYLGSLDEIYLTQLAIATIGNTATTQAHYNSMQRRDVLELFELEDANKSEKDILTDNGIGYNLSSTTKIENTTITSKMPKKKISLIGRPKSYNLEDLTSVDNDENHGKSIQEISKRENDFYFEYEFIGTQENTTENLELSNVTVTEFYSLNENTNGSKEAAHNEQLNISLDGLIDSFNLNMTWNSTSENALVNLNITDVEIGKLPIIEKSVEDYLSDPETVRQLQEALDRMEHKMWTQDVTQRQSKVRREIRKLSQGVEDTNSTDNVRYNAEVERNKTLARGPMMNMVLKYMPYLKEYESGMLGKSTNSVDRLSSSALLVILLIVIV